jgi:hypothetical protein
VESKWEVKEWVDQDGVAEDKKTPAQSIQERVHHIKTDTQETAISSMHDTITKFANNVWLTHLSTLLDSNGHIRSGQVEEDVFEALRLHYFEYKKKLRPNKYGQTERDSEKEGVEQGKSEDDVKLQAAKDRFHPTEFYVFVQQGPSVIEGQNNVCLLQDAAAMQKALGDGRGSHRRLRDKTSVDLETETRSNKQRSVANTISNVLLASPAGSSASSVPSSASTFASSAAWAEDRRERDRRWELDRTFVATDRLASRLVLSLVYGCGMLCICICIHLYMYDALCIYIHWYMIYADMCPLTAGCR